ncbi:YkgJ family cysteine cluster protein, partial [Methanogenium cariaci]|uniref:YkgJ family cysteine cluster protein n=1 Tax=Methanogenium cariaci TaxID=2197 RepID=UPI0012F6937B
MEHEDFSCTKCGRCCFGMGKYVRVIGQMGMNQVVVKHEIANETVYATIPRKYRDDFDFAEARSVTEGWCPFLCEENGEYPCIIFDSAPRFCKDFTCCRMRVFDAAGGRSVARIKGKGSLLTDDDAFSEWWKTTITVLPDDNWEEEAS